MDIKRFGPGNRRPGGPPGTQGVSGQVIFHDSRAIVSELAFQRYAIVTPHANQSNTAIFIVISGGGFVQVGDERARVNHGEAVIWPPGLRHGAYTDGTEMRAIIVELTGEDDALISSDAEAVVPGEATEGAAAAQAATPTADAPPRPAPTKADGTLAERKISREEYDSTEGEPW
jgi:quercetin dioxygenase-like cupin family protein